ncbi:MAG TPA: hypothetical protein VH561_16815 [Micromonosporaceae bacterium]
MILLYALFVSASHLARVGLWLGLKPYEANTLFVLVDAVVVTGKLMTLNVFAPTTKRCGKRLMILAGVVSLAGNVGSGVIDHSIGGAGYGVLVLAVAFLMEHAIGKIRPAAAVTKAANVRKQATARPAVSSVR